MAKQPKGELVPVAVGFNYDLLEAKVAEQVRTSADRIRERVKKTVEDIIEVGNDLLAVKEVGDEFLRREDHAGAAAVYEGILAAVLDNYQTVHDEEGDLAQRLLDLRLLIAEGGTNA